MLTSFRVVKTINLGNIDPKRHGYEQEQYEAVSNESFEEAKNAVIEQVNARLRELVDIRDRVETAKSVQTKS